MFTVDRTLQINGDPNEPRLARSQIWRGLVMKAENAVPFVPAISYCQVMERGDGHLIREIVLRGERLRERVTFYPERTVKFDRLSGSAMGTILNEIVEDERDALLVRFTFTLEVEGLAHGSPEEAAYAKMMEDDYMVAVTTTVKTIRRLVKDGSLAA